MLLYLLRLPPFTARLASSAATWRLQAKQEAGLKPSLSLYLVEGDVRRLGPGSPRIYVFKILVSNLSDMANSIRDASVVIEHAAPAGPTPQVAIPHNPDLAVRVTGAADALRLPVAIAGRNAVGGTLLFGVVDELIGAVRIESYTLKISDTYGLESSVEILLLQEREP